MRCASFASVRANASFCGVVRTPFMVKRSVANAAPAEAIWRMPVPAEAAWAVAHRPIWRRECFAFINGAWRMFRAGPRERSQDWIPNRLSYGV